MTLSAFDFQTNKRRTARFSLFALPPPPEFETTPEAGAETKSELAIAVLTSPVPSLTEPEPEKKTRGYTLILAASIGALLLAFAAFLTLQVIYDLKHPHLGSPDINKKLAEALYPSTTSFYVKAASANEAEAKIKSVPKGAHVGLIYTIDKCHPKQMMQLVELSDRHNITDLTLVPSTLDYAHTSACLYFLESAIQGTNCGTKIYAGVMRQPKAI